MALITTFATTPLVVALYPPWYQVKLEAWKRGEIDWDGNRLTEDDPVDAESLPSEKARATEVSSLLVHLRLDTMPGVLALVSLFTRRTGTNVATNIHPSKRLNTTGDSQALTKRPFQVQGIRLKELTDRESSVMKVSNFDEYTLSDPVLSTFRITLGQIVNVAVRGIVVRCLPDVFANTIVDTANDTSADLTILSWSVSGNMSENQIIASESSTAQRFENSSFSQFISKILSQKKPSSKTAIFVDNGFGVRHRQPAEAGRKRSIHSLSEIGQAPLANISLQDQGHHIYFPYFGSVDDEAALRLVLQLADDPSVTATIVLFELPDSGAADDSTFDHATLFFSLRDSLPAALAQRVEFEVIKLTETDSPAAAVVAKAKTEVGQTPKNAGDLIILGRNTSLRVLQNASSEWNTSDAGRTLGPMAGAILDEKERLISSLLVMYASGN
jgi:hypothetical protein